MTDEQWLAFMKDVLAQLGELRPALVQSAVFDVSLHPLAGSGPAPLNDGRPKIITLTIATSG